MPTSPSSPWYSPRTRVILVTAPPVNATQRGGELASRNPPLAPDRTHETTKSYAQAVIDAGDKLGVPVVDLWTALWKEAGETEQGLESLLPDGIHCNERSYSVCSCLRESCAMFLIHYIICYRFYTISSLKPYWSIIQSYISINSRRFIPRKLRILRQCMLSDFSLLIVGTKLTGKTQALAWYPTGLTFELYSPVLLKAMWMKAKIGTSSRVLLKPKERKHITLQSSRWFMLYYPPIGPKWKSMIVCAWRTPQNSCRLPIVPILDSYSREFRHCAPGGPYKPFSHGLKYHIQKKWKPMPRSVQY